MEGGGGFPGTTSPHFDLSTASLDPMLRGADRDVTDVTQGGGGGSHAAPWAPTSQPSPTRP